MKKIVKLVIVISFSFIFLACAGGPRVAIKPMDPFSPPAVNPTTGQPTCTIYEDMGITGGLIHEKILNPCAAQNILITVAQTGFAMEQYKLDQFKEWAVKVKAAISGGNMSYTAFRAYILKAILDQNKKMGMVLFAASGMIDIFEGESLIHPDDVKLMLASIDDLVKQVESMAVLIG